MPMARHVLGASAINDEIYIIGGGLELRLNMKVSIVNFSYGQEARKSEI